MRKNIIKLIFRSFVLISACLFQSNALLASSQVIFQIKDIPSYTPASDTLYICSSLNNWKLKDPQFAFHKLPDGSYRLALNLASNEQFDFKINRGSWASVEGNEVGEFRSNRLFRNAEHIYESNIVVKSWQDLHKDNFPPVEIKVLKIPDNTPPDAKLYIAGTFNGWKCDDPDYELVQLKDGTYRCEIDFGVQEFYYKFTRGSWQSVEARWDGGFMSNRKYIKQPETSPVTIKVNIKGWEDLSNGQNGWKIVFIVWIIQNIITLTLMIRTNKPKLLSIILVISLISFALNFLFMNNTISGYFLKGMFIPGCLFAALTPLFYIALKTYLDSKVHKNKLTFILAFLPFCIYIYLFSLSKESFNLKTIENETTAIFLGIYSYAIIIGVYFTYRLFNIIRKNNVPPIVLRLVNAWKYVIIVTTLLVLGGLITNHVHIDKKLVVDWMENAIWSTVGVFIIISQLLLVNQALEKKVKHQYDTIKESAMDKIQEDLMDKISTVMQHKKLYLNPKFTLNELSRHVGSNTYYVSKVLNEGFQVSFTDYINSLRIEAFIKDFKEHADPGTFIQYAYKVGFNSKSAFNRAFKKKTGSTPSEYFSKMKENAI
ncbi:MAG: helix-turn-helix domain-containing protein [Bacteroidales bacterium]|nr:helix-turn-helix domain-containing protein [Bacteroidales bacterium]